MCTRKIKIRSLLLFLLSVACLCAGLLFSAPNGGSASIDGVFHEIGAGGQTYLLCLDGGTAEISDLHYKELCRYDIGDGTVIMSRCISDLDRDGTDEILLITGPDGSEYGTELLILTLKAGGTGEQTDARDFPVHDTDNISLDVIYKRDMADINPWKVQTCDVDGDGRTEISVGVYKTARFHPVMAKRPFIYEWHGNAISPKWLGSRLSRPFNDYMFADINADGMDEIISIEHLRDGRKAVTSYAWKGFGFEGIGESAGFDDILCIGKTRPGDGRPEAIEALVLEEGHERRVVLRLDDDMLIHSYADTI